MLRADEAPPPLFGLVLAGGNSTRMARDKACLDYHGAPQFAFCHALLCGRCDRTFVSLRAGQDAAPFAGYEIITDRYANIGPMSGVLSAFEEHSAIAWLVLACDLPFVNEVTLARLATARNAGKPATVYLSDATGFPEPLCAIYEPRIAATLMTRMRNGEFSLRRILSSLDVEQVRPGSREELTNVNFPEEYTAARTALAKTDVR